jgi:hypothetical protein
MGCAQIFMGCAQLSSGIAEDRDPRSIAARGAPLRRLIFADVSEVYAQGAQLAVQVCTFHADPLGELTHLAIT